MPQAKNFTALASAARSASTNQVDTNETPLGANAIIITLDVTTSSLDTEQVVIQSYDPVSNKFTDFASFTAAPASTIATYQKVLTPFTAPAPGGTNVEGKIGPLPHLWRLRVVHVGAAGVTYSVGVAYS